MSRYNLGFLCRTFPPAVAVGLGMRPVRAVTSSSAGMRTAGIQARPDLCPFVRSVLDGVCSAEGLFGTVDAWVGMYTCDMTRRLFQELQRISVVPVFQLQLPATRTAETSEWFAGSIREVALSWSVPPLRLHGMFIDYFINHAFLPLRTDVDPITAVAENCFDDRVIRDTVKRELGLPVLSFDVPYSPGRTSEQVRNRLEAFIEIMRLNRKRRA